MTGPELAAIVREHTERAVSAALAPVLALNKALELRLLELETRPAVVGPPGAKGDSGLPGVGVASLILSAEGRLVAHLSDGRTLDAGPVPRGTDGLPGAPGEPGAKGLDGLQGAPGRDADQSVVLDLKSGLERLQASLESLPAPVAGPAGAQGVNGTDGVSVTVADVAPLIAAELQKAVAAIPSPTNGLSGKDGIGVMDAVLDRAGHLLLTLSDGRTKDVGLVTGRDADVRDELDPDDIEATFHGYLRKELDLLETSSGRTRTT